MRCLSLIFSLALLASSPVLAANVVVGDFQTSVGCGANQDPGCAETALTTRAHDGIEATTLLLPAGNWQFRLALNDGAGGYVGENGELGGAAIPLTLTAETPVTFLYDPVSRWLVSQQSHVIATAAGNFQSELGCPGDWSPDCLRSWLKDVDADGVYTFSTTALPAGSYEVKVAHGQSWDENYGVGGIPGGANFDFTVSAAGDEVHFSYVLTTHVLTVTVQSPQTFDLTRARAHWLTDELIAWDVGALPANGLFELHAAPTGGIALSGGGVDSPERFTLTLDVLPEGVRAKWPHLANLAALRLPAAAITRARELSRGQLVVTAKLPSGALARVTSLQFAGALDALFPYDGPLGASFSEDGAPTLRVWAPTARDVSLLLHADATTPSSTSHPMVRDPVSGVWSVTGTPEWKGRYFVYRVEVFRRTSEQVVTNLVTDPYGHATSTNGKRTQIVNLADPALAPAGWATLAKPALGGIQDTVLYELHVRDFSIGDPTVPAAHRGTFLAFTDTASEGMKHLARLAKAGLTHVHLLPVFDIGTVNEDRTAHEEPAGGLFAMAPDSEQQQSAVRAVASKDGFNWGYDPLHYTVPEGSYATDPQGSPRILEFREMVRALAGAGLRTVMDVVYNHTHKAGQAEGSVLDRIVPDYYHRLNADGAVETSTCCANTATEHAMMGRLVIDSVLTWARAYKVDGFRFDLMGHHPKANILAVRAALDSLTLAKDGVEGTKIVLYGEGWNFGEVVNGARFVNATQENMAGTGIATFNDRLRDALRGGTPFHGLQDQGFATGLVSAPNGVTPGTAEERAERMRNFLRGIQVGLVGGLADFPVAGGTQGRDVFINGLVAGYTKSPLEVVNYASAHDNETLFDSVQLKAPRTLSMDDRVRMHNLATSVIALGHGLPLFHAGDELLRSKSLDRNSYDSGDWFNRIDWTGQTNAWGSGLPPAPDNGSHWGVMGPLLADPALRPEPKHMLRARDHFEELLKLRKSSSLFKSTNAAQARARVSFSVIDSEALVMTLSEAEERLVVVFNPRSSPVRVPKDPAFTYALHPVQAESTDERLGAISTEEAELTVPALSTVVLTLTALEDAIPPPLDPGEEVEPRGCGCATTSGAMGAFGLVLAAALARRRRR